VKVFCAEMVCETCWPFDVMRKIEPSLFALGACVDLKSAFDAVIVTFPESAEA
jgi:hypothetical protein